MNILISVFKKNWVEGQLLFDFLRVFNITIDEQALYGDSKDQIKGTHLYINNDTRTAKWLSVEEAKNLCEKEFVATLHYDARLYSLRKMYGQSENL